ncbi:unnamed protein product [Gongylonema pulchrum]|uniref:Protein kinase domain-containing protein n=1 Tax=Gongylonema pulchrum TaxID=637853 RepID=A0A183CWQ8_9BILA|nr:unnamed protein product [Gongylonema pulchrum]
MKVNNIKLSEKQIPDRNDEETLAGLNKKAKAGIATSTPASSFPPPVEDPIEGSPINIFNQIWSAADQFFQQSVFDKAIGEGTAFGKRMSLSEQRRVTMTRLSEKFGAENIVGNKVAGLSAESSVNEELRRLSIVPNEADAEEHTGQGLKSVIESEVNPWDENVRNKIMCDRHFVSTNLHDFQEKCGRFNPDVRITLGGERFDVKELIAQGGFARVYKCISEDGNTYAIKYEIPPCRWEVYICESLRNRMPQAMLHSVMNVRDAYIFSNASAIVYEYHSCGNLLDMVNRLQEKQMSCSELLSLYLAWEMSRILKMVHAAQIIHGDVKPDNFMITHGLDENATVEEILDKRSFTLKLIDWGRAIDMGSLKGCKFRGKAGTDAFDCFEMQDGRPWTYQTDFFGFIATLHVIIYGKYMKTFRVSAERYAMTSVLKRRWQQLGLLKDIFDMCMNIPDCESLPKWSIIIDGLESSIK